MKADWVLGRLREIVRHAAACSPFYEERFRAAGFDPRADFSFADFAELPALTRKDVRSASLARILCPVDGTIEQTATGGSTGEPTIVHMGPRERGWRRSGATEHRTSIGVGPGTRMALLWGHHLDPVASDKLKDRLRDWASNRRWFDCFRMSADVLSRYHSELEQYQPECILAYASAVDELAEYLESAGITPSYPSRCIITGAEKLFPFQRERLDRVFQKPVFEQYGTRDVGGIAYQRSAETSELPVDWALVLVEPADSAPTAPILITKLQADAMPMIRYEIGDMGTFPPGSLPGHPTFVLREVLGRTVDKLLLPDGTWLHGNQVPHLMKDFPVTDFLLHQRADGSVKLKLVPADGFNDAHVRAIESALSANLAGVPLEIELAPDIGRGAANKWRPVISDIAQLS